jgi:hypothetical protein
MAFLHRIAEATGIPFRVLFRAPFALLDAGTAVLLLVMLRDKPYRLAAAAGYWLHPLALIFSAYHGNMDSAVAFFLLLCIWLLTKERPVLAGVAVGVSLWIKLPGVLALPVILLLMRTWRARLTFLSSVAVTVLVTYAPALWQDARIVYTNVLAYRGQVLQTASGIPIWGTRVFVSPWYASLSPEWQARLYGPVLFFLGRSWAVALGLFALLRWVRPSCRSSSEVGGDIAAVYTIVYAFTNQWAFQYLAWSLPFWFFRGLWFSLPATVLAGGYIYSVYCLVCGNPWLLGEWDFAGHASWPQSVQALRDLALLFFLVSACVFVGGAAWEQIVGRGRRANTSGGGARPSEL